MKLVVDNLNEILDKHVKQSLRAHVLLADNIVNEFLGKRNLRKLIYNESAAATLVAAVFEKLATPRVYLEEKIEREFLTKNPARYHEFDFPRNCWLGTTVNCQGDMYRLIDLSLTPSKNLIFVSFEPLYSEIQMTFYRPPDWIIIGAQTNPPNPPVQPEREWVEKLISDARTIGARIFLKDNLDYPEKIKEFPAP